MDAKTRSSLNRELGDVAMGWNHADLVIRKGKWVYVESSEILSQTDIAIKNDRIAFVGYDPTHRIRKDTKFVETMDRYLFQV